MKPAVALLVALLGFVLALPLQPMPAVAHANLDRAEPPPDSRLHVAPSRLTLYFTQPLVRRSSWIALRDASGNDLALTLEFDDADPKLMRARIGPLAPSVYTVKWQTLSAADDDFADGSFRLTVLRADGSDPGATLDMKARQQPVDDNASAAFSPSLVVALVVGLALIAAAVLITRQRSAA